MPIYEFVCGKCSHKFETFIQLRDAHKIQQCPKCDEKTAERIMSAASVGSSSSSGSSCMPEGGCGSSGFG